MHQHPRQPPTAASPASSPITNPSRTDSQRQDERHASQTGGDSSRGLGLEKGLGPWEQRQGSETPSQDSVAKLNQIVQNYFTKAALIILHTRVDLPPAYTRETNVKRVNKWFNVELDETEVLRDVLAPWRSCHFIDNRPPPMIIETYLDARQLTNQQSLVIIDEDGRRCDVLEALSTLPLRGFSDHNNRTVVLERWQVELGDTSGGLPSDLAAQLPTIYKKSIVLFRSLWTYAKFLPAWKFSKQHSKARFNSVLTPRYRIFQSLGEDSSIPDSLTAPLYQGNHKPSETYSFGSTESPAGPFSVNVTYRTNCEFRVDDSEALLSSRFMGADDDFFRPSLPSEDTVRAGDQEVGSLPVDRRDSSVPDRSQAYGSLSTFHQVGPTGASPISALRAARDLGEHSPGSPSHLPQSPSHAQAARVAIRSGEANHPFQRRPSVSFQPFKAPPLSASPATSHTRNISEPSKPTSDDKSMPPPSIAASATRRHTQIVPENAIASSTSASPKQTPISKYSSSFSHRRGRLSSGGGSKADEDNTSSGRVSASSSTAQPSSGIAAEAGGTSSGSWHADDENISDFLKMLDLKKDLLSPGNSSAVDANTRRTAAALTRFHKMKDANAALSDSMSSSMLLQKSSTSSSRQLPNVPPMIPATSISTSSSPGKAMSPHTPHTPAIPSRLSSNSIVDYSHHDTSGNRRRISHQSRESPLEETPSDENTLQPTVSNAAAIDIPTSPPFIPDFRRASSAAQRRPEPGPEDELGDFFFAMRSMSLGAEDRSPLSLSALLRQQEQDNPLPSARPHDQDRQQRTADQNTSDAASESQSRPESSSTSQPYQPRFPHPQGRGSAGRPPSRSSVSRNLGRGNGLPSNIRDRDREVGNESGSNSGISTTVDVRRRGSHRFSFNRPNFEEDEPLLFTMSDFGTSRRSLEEARRDPSSGGDSATPASSRQNNGSGQGGSACSFQPWQ